MSSFYQDGFKPLGQLLVDAGTKGEATLLIPDLQRPYVWTPGQVVNLVDSLIRGWPFGSLLLWSVSKDQSAKMPYRNFSRIVDRVELEHVEVAQKHHPADHKMVLDGQQRLQSMLIAFGGDEWGIKMLDKDWKAELTDTKSPGRSAKSWSMRHLCIDLMTFIDKVNENSGRVNGVSFTEDILCWCMFSKRDKSRSISSKPIKYDAPLFDADSEEFSGRFLPLCRLWSIADNKNYNELGDLEHAANDLLRAYKVSQELIHKCKSPLVSLIDILKKVTSTRVTYLEIQQYAASKSTCDTHYTDAVVNIFTRLNTAGRTLTRSEITFAWVKFDWDASATNLQASKAFDILLKDLEHLDLPLSLDELMSIISYMWAVNFNSGKLLSPNDLLSQKVMKPMSINLSSHWTQLCKAIKHIAEILKQRGLLRDKHFQSLNSISVLCAWRLSVERHTASIDQSHSQSTQYKLESLDPKIAELYERWIICSQWAGYWEKGSLTISSKIAGNLSELPSKLAESSDIVQGLNIAINLLEIQMNECKPKAKANINQLSATDEKQTGRLYFLPLWLWHRLDDQRWEQSCDPLRPGKKSAKLEVDHIIPVALWKEQLPLDYESDEYTLEDNQLHELGNCLLLEKSFNISKGKKPLKSLISDTFGITNSTRIFLFRDALCIDNGQFTCDPQDIFAWSRDIAKRTQRIRSDLIEYIDGERPRVDLK